MNTTIELKEATEIINKIEKIEVPQSLEVCCFGEILI